MASPNNSPHALDTSAERLDTAQRWLEAHAPMLRKAGRDAGLMATIGLLICDDNGHIAEAAMLSAMRDPDAISAAELLLSAVLR